MRRWRRGALSLRLVPGMTLFSMSASWKGARRRMSSEYSPSQTPALRKSSSSRMLFQTYRELLQLLEPYGTVGLQELREVNPLTRGRAAGEIAHRVQRCGMSSSRYQCRLPQLQSVLS
jgi:hypothetical protein